MSENHESPPTSSHPASSTLPDRSVFDLPHRVDRDEIDAQGHVHNLRYLQWSLWAAGKHSEALGYDAAEALGRGMGWVVREHQIVYRAAALADDALVIRTWVCDADRFSSRRKTSVCRPADRKVLARVETRWVYVDLNRHRVVPIPEDLSRLYTVRSGAPLPWESN